MYNRILVPLDGSPTSDFGLTEAIAMAKMTHGKIRLMHVIDEISVMDEIQSYAGMSTDWFQALHANGAHLVELGAAEVRKAGISVDTIVLDGFACRLHELVAAEVLQWHADLIVLGTHGRRGLKRIYLGSDAEDVLRYSTIPVMLVRYHER